MRINTTEVREGLHNNKTVWICHYNHPDLHKKPLRNIKPTKAIIMSLSDIANVKNMYYTKSCFVPLNKSNSPLKKYISPVDNTGFRSHYGNELFVFDTEAECRTEWDKQIDEYITRKDDWMKSLQAEWDIEKKNLLKG